MDRYINAPIDNEIVNSLKAGDCVYITGTIYTARDAAHKRMYEAIKNGENIPFELKNNIIYYLGPQYAYFKPAWLAKVFTLGKSTSLINSGWTMYLPALFANGLRAGLFIFIFRQFFRGLPKELEDAAYLDGCSPLKTFLVIMCPNAKSSFLTVFLFSIVWYWNDYYVSSSFFTQNDTVALMLKNLNTNLTQQLFDGQAVSVRQIIVWLEAGCLLSITPILIMYVFLQRYFIEGVERSGLAN